MRRTLWLWGPVVIYAVAIFVESSISQVPELPTGVTDKDVHSLLYAGLAVLVLRAVCREQWQRVTWWTALVTVILTAAYGASDEFHQRFVPGRTADLLDLAADAVGAAITVIVIWSIARWKRARA